MSIPRVECVTNANIATFGETANGILNPAVSIPRLIEGTPDDSDFGSLGLANQVNVFRQSVADFADGPREVTP